MRQLAFICIYLMSLTFCSTSYAVAQNKIATADPISHSLTKALIEDTELTLVYLPPKRLPINRIPNWVSKNASHKFDHIDVLVGMSSVYKGLDLYPSLRQTNIRLVKIDIANALIPNGERVVMNADTEYFWLNSNNLLLMLGILKRDVIALWPDLANHINKNYQKAAAAIRRTNLTIDDLLMNKEIAFIIAKNEQLTPFISSLSSDSSSEQQAIDLGLNYLKLTNGKEANPNYWLIDDFSRFSEKTFIERLQSHSVNLERVFKK